MLLVLMPTALAVMYCAYQRFVRHKVPQVVIPEFPYSVRVSLFLLARMLSLDPTH